MLGIFIALFVIIFNGAWLWFCYVYVTNDHHRWWMEMVVWAFIAKLLAFPLIYTVHDSPWSVLKVAAYSGGYLLTYGFLYAVLTMRYNVEKMADKAKILFAHFVGVFILGRAIKLVI
jgi:hypothetical protein